MFIFHDISNKQEFMIISFSIQPRDTCYVASIGLPELSYSGYQPHPYSWDDYPPLKDILDVVRMLTPCRFLLC